MPTTQPAPTPDHPSLCILETLCQTWNNGDATGYAACFTPDATYTTYFGATMHGRDQIEEGHRWLFDGPGRGSRLTLGQAPHVTTLADSVAIILTEGGTSPAGQPPCPDHSTLTYVTTRMGGQWQIASFQNTRRVEP